MYSYDVHLNNGFTKLMKLSLTKFTEHKMGMPVPDNNPVAEEK